MCAQTGQVSERDAWPGELSTQQKFSGVSMSLDVQVSQIDWSQQGRRKAFTASLLQMAHRSLKGMSSWDRVLRKKDSQSSFRGPHISNWTYLAMSMRPAGGSAAAMAGSRIWLHDRSSTSSGKESELEAKGREG